MTKEDLKNGMVVKLRNNQRLIVFNGNLYNPYSKFLLEYYTNDLAYCGPMISFNTSEQFDIMEIYDNAMCLLWGRSAKEEPKMNWFEPVEKEYYLLVEYDGIISYQRRRGDWDENVLIHNKVYRTEAEARKAAERQKAYIKIVKRIAELNEGWVPDWRNEYEDKWYVLYDNDSYHKCFDTDCYVIDQFLPNEWYLKSNELAERLISELEPELKLWFEVEE